MQHTKSSPPFQQGMNTVVFLDMIKALSPHLATCVDVNLDAGMYYLTAMANHINVVQTDHEKFSLIVWNSPCQNKYDPKFEFNGLDRDRVITLIISFDMESRVKYLRKKKKPAA